MNFFNIHRKTPVLESLFNNIAGLQACNFIKRDSNTDAFLWILRNFRSTYFEEQLRMAASEKASLDIWQSPEHTSDLHIDAKGVFRTYSNI